MIEAGEPNAPTDEWIEREDTKGGEKRERAKCQKDKTAAKQKKAKSPTKATRSYCNRLSFRSEEEGKEYAQQIGEGKSSGATGRSDLPFPKEMVQREAGGDSKVEWEIQAVGVPMVL